MARARTQTSIVSTVGSPGGPRARAGKFGGAIKIAASLSRRGGGGGRGAARGRGTRTRRIGGKGICAICFVSQKIASNFLGNKADHGGKGADQRARAAVEQVPADAAVRERDGAAVGLRCRCAPGYENAPWTINESSRCMAFAWGGSAARGCVRGGSVLKSSVFIVKRSERPDSFQSGVTVVQFSKSEGLFDHGRGGGDCASLREVRVGTLHGPGW